MKRMREGEGKRGTLFVNIVFIWFVCLFYYRDKFIETVLWNWLEGFCYFFLFFCFVFIIINKQRANETLCMWCQLLFIYLVRSLDALKINKRSTWYWYLSVRRFGRPFGNGKLEMRIAQRIKISWCLPFNLNCFNSVAN